jgi:hypothetical protein
VLNLQTGAADCVSVGLYSDSYAPHHRFARDMARKRPSVWTEGVWPEGVWPEVMVAPHPRSRTGYFQSSPSKSGVPPASQPSSQPPSKQSKRHSQKPSAVPSDDENFCFKWIGHQFVKTGKCTFSIPIFVRIWPLNQPSTMNPRLTHSKQSSLTFIEVKPDQSRPSSTHLPTPQPPRPALSPPS